MAKSAPAIDPFRDMMAQVTAQNPEMRARAEAIMDAFLTNVERAMKIGDPQTMAIYARVILPTMMRSLRDGDREAGEDKRQAAMERVMARLRGEPEGSDGALDHSAE